MPIAPTDSKGTDLKIFLTGSRNKCSSLTNLCRVSIRVKKRFWLKKESIWSRTLLSSWASFITPIFSVSLLTFLELDVFFSLKNSGVIKSKLKLNIQAEYLKILKVNKKKLFHPVVWINFWRYEAKSGKKIQRPIIHWNEFGLQVSNRNGRIFLAGKKTYHQCFRTKSGFTRGF